MIDNLNFELNGINSKTLLGSDSTRLILGGINKGRTLALYVGLNYPKKLGDIFGINGACIKEMIQNNINSEIPVFITHGKLEKFVGFEAAYKSYETNNILKRKNLTINWIDNASGGVITVLDQFKLVRKWVYSIGIDK